MSEQSSPFPEENTFEAKDTEPLAPDGPFTCTFQFFVKRHDGTYISALYETPIGTLPTRDTVNEIIARFQAMLPPGARFMTRHEFLRKGLALAHDAEILGPDFFTLAVDPIHGTA
jgi:hypothetical protein